MPDHDQPQDFEFSWLNWGEEILSDLAIEPLNFERELIVQHVRDILESMAWKQLNSLLQEGSIRLGTQQLLADELGVNKSTVSHWLRDGPAHGGISLRQYLAVLLYFHAAVPPGGSDGYGRWVRQLVIRLISRIREHYLLDSKSKTGPRAPELSESEFTILHLWFQHIHSLNFFRRPASLSNRQLAQLVNTVMERFKETYKRMRVQSHTIREVILRWEASYILFRYAFEDREEWVQSHDEPIGRI